GMVLYVGMRYWKGIYSLFPTTWSFNSLYNFMLEQIEIRSSSFTRLYMTGYLRDYLKYIYLFFIMVTGGTLVLTKAFSFDLTDNASIGIYVWILVIVMLVAGIAILFAKSRLTAIILNGILGYSISVFFVLFRAPDLALTQLVVETVTTALFLLCFYFLP